MTLDVAIATWQPSGLERVARMCLPQLPGVGYVVSWQEAGSDPVIPPELACRHDVRVVMCDVAGVSANRNNALRHCTADIVLMGDDDITYFPDGLRKLIAVFEENPALDLATFMYEGSDNKQYPRESVKLGWPLPKNFGVSMIEIAVRRQSLRGLEFDELFGPGAPVWQAAEDEKLLWDARKRGLNCRFYPIRIMRHEGLTTGFQPIRSAGVAAASGRIIRLEYPTTWPMRLMLKSFREWRKGADGWFCLRHMVRGAFSSGTV